jgi:hypothetical protein
MSWCEAVADQRDAIGFAEKVLKLLDEGRYTATYKYAVARWARRFAAESPEHQQPGDLAQQTAWEREPDKTASVARGIYLRLPADAQLWLRRREFVGADGARLAAVLTPAGSEHDRLSPETTPPDHLRTESR